MGSTKKQAKLAAIDIGISQDDRVKIVKGLSRLLAGQLHTLSDDS